MICESQNPNYIKMQNKDLSIEDNQDIWDDSAIIKAFERAVKSHSNHKQKKPEVRQTRKSPMETTIPEDKEEDFSEADRKFEALLKAGDNIESDLNQKIGAPGPWQIVEPQTADNRPKPDAFNPNMRSANPPPAQPWVAPLSGPPPSDPQQFHFQSPNYFPPGTLPRPEMPGIALGPMPAPPPSDSWRRPEGFAPNTYSGPPPPQPWAHPPTAEVPPFPFQQAPPPSAEAPSFAFQQARSFPPPPIIRQDKPSPAGPGAFTTIANDCLDRITDDAVHDLCMAWYYCGYFTGKYSAIKDLPKST